MISSNLVLATVSALILCACATAPNVANLPPLTPPRAASPPPPPPATAVPPTLKPVQLETDVYPLWYATNRRPVSAKDESMGYSSERDSRLHYGKAFVTIPKDYLQNLRTDSWIKKLFFKSGEATLKVRNKVPMPVAEFITDVKLEITKNSPTERFAVVYIHGFQTTFDEAAQRAASIGYQIKSPTTVFFSWPSKGKVAGYEADKNSVEASSDQLASFIIRFSRESGAQKVHLIAHSMGNYALLQTMFRPVMQKAIQSGLRFGQIILAAPDVDRDVFARDAHLYARVADRVTLYASNKDVALIASKKLSDFPRAGLLQPPTVVPGIDTLDVSTVDLTWLGHSYVATEIQVIEDINKLILHNDPPQRRSRVLPATDGPYWVLR